MTWSTFYLICFLVGLLLVMSFIGLRSGRGSRQMVAGILILFAASGIQASGVDVFTPLDRNGLYHLVSMIGVAFLYLGGVQLRTDLAPLV
jgi:hypothetical protein